MRRRLVLAALATGALARSNAQALMAGLPPDSPEARIDPDDRRSPWAGVGALLVKGGVYSGALIGPRHVLTAAHVVAARLPEEIAFRINGTGMSASIAARAVHTHPRFDGFRSNGWPRFDIAIVELVEPAPPEVPVYDLYYGSLRAGTPLTFVGYGASGRGDAGPSVAARADVRRIGQNNADRFIGDDNAAGRPQLFLYDFDGPTADTNAMGGRGLGNAQETSAATGDSGAPAFVVRGEYRQLVGVLTFVSGLGRPNTSLSRFGASGGGTLVSSARAWIESILAAARSEAAR